MIRHIMETFSVLLTLCEGIHWWTAVPPNNRPVMQSFDVFISWRGTGWCSSGITVMEIFIQVDSIPGVQQTTHKQSWSRIYASHRNDNQRARKMSTKIRVAPLCTSRCVRRWLMLRVTTCFSIIHREPVPLHRIATLAIDDYTFVAGDRYMR